jgi:hypothetical protein
VWEGDLLVSSFPSLFLSEVVLAGVFAPLPPPHPWKTKTRKHPAFECSAIAGCCWLAVVLDGDLALNPAVARFYQYQSHYMIARLLMLLVLSHLISGWDIRYDKMASQ